MSILTATVAPNQDDVVRVRLRYPDLETFVERFAPNVTRGGVFLASREPRPVGEVIRFEVLLKGAGPVLSGEGRVTWVKDFNPAEPHRPYGMGVQFRSIDPTCRPVLERLLKRKEQASPGEPAGAARASAPPSEGRATGSFAPLGDGGFGEIEETAVRRALDRARALSSRTDDLEALLAPEPQEPVSLSQALSDLPRLLGGGRRPTGMFRPLGEAPAPAEPEEKG